MLIQLTYLTYFVLDIRQHRKIKAVLVYQGEIMQNVNCWWLNNWKTLTKCPYKRRVSLKLHLVCINKYILQMNESQNVQLQLRRVLWHSYEMQRGDMTHGFQNSLTIYLASSPYPTKGKNQQNTEISSKLRNWCLQKFILELKGILVMYSMMFAISRDIC